MHFSSALSHVSLSVSSFRCLFVWVFHITDHAIMPCDAEATQERWCEVCLTLRAALCVHSHACCVRCLPLFKIIETGKLASARLNVQRCGHHGGSAVGRPEKVSPSQVGLRLPADRYLASKDQRYSKRKQPWFFSIIPMVKTIP